MRRFILAFALALLSNAAQAEDLKMYKIPAGVECGRSNCASCTNGLCINAQGLNAAKYTGWINVSDYDTIFMDVTFVDANDSVTAVTTTCYTSDDPTTANGSGAEICSTSTTSGTTTYTCPNVRSHTTGTAEHWGINVNNIGGTYINCGFDATGTPAAADTVTVYVWKISP